MTIYQDGGRFPEFYRPGGISAPPPGSAGALPPVFYLPPGDKKPGMLSAAPTVTNPDLSPGYQTSVPAPAATPIAPVSPVVAPAPAAPSLPAGFSLDAGNDYPSFYNTFPAGTNVSGTGRPAGGKYAAVPAIPMYASASAQGLIDNGFYNATDYVKGRIGGTDITPVFYNPATGQWAYTQGRGQYIVSDAPHLTTIDNNNDYGLGNIRELAGAAMTGWSPVLTAAGLTGVDFLGAGGMLSDAATATGIPASVLGPAATFGANLALTGNPKAALKGTAIGAGIGATAQYLTPALNEFLASLGLDASQIPPEDLKRLTADASGSVPLYSTPAATEFDAAGNPVRSTPAMTTMGGEGMLPSAVQTGAIVPGMLSSPELQNLDQQDKEALSQKEIISQKDIERVAKLTQSLAKLGQGTTPQDAPQRGKGQSDEQYAQQLAQYANLDSQAMATLGLVPGSQEYYRYIMDQMDSVIAQLTDGMDINAADLTDQLHAKSAAELQQLQRALYVRGQMDSLAGSGQYVDPFTGLSEDVTAPGGEQFNPAVGAYQRGLARSTGEVAQGGEAGMAALQGMLSRNVDLFSLQKQQDARHQLALLDAAIQEQSGTKKRKGMFGENPNDVMGLQNQVSQMSPQELENLLKRLGI